ncbi:phage integrase family protein [Caballeronia choica]|uniref:Phage integrase family protein n=1 Tax=Caballeronia choica TaxID=326476 RepID=A0A158KGW9_9BURK|nr:phage integrase N-terminal SAM-like domain-containing protein [Caballeronia choica]SAL80347.1 phage integrase family protein [Caballeronia choica]
MTHTSQDVSPLRQRMIDDMRMRKLAPKTQAGYVRVVRQFTAFLGRPPDTAAVEDLRRYQLHLYPPRVSARSPGASDSLVNHYRAWIGMPVLSDGHTYTNALLFASGRRR